ncbi:hypothetical protein F2P79_025387 [Pimephales promelas]|nr:hypothetical protein F2P79_025387 [Pimephales promelas]
MDILDDMGVMALSTYAEVLRISDPEKQTIYPRPLVQKHRECVQNRASLLKRFTQSGSVLSGDGPGPGWAHRGI